MRASHSRAARNETGASAVEYGLLLAGIAALIVIVVFAFGGMVTGMLTNSCQTIGSHEAPSTTLSC